MRGPTTKSFKRGFLKSLLSSLGSARNGAASKAMSLQERKRAIKSFADVAMATARGGGARWPKAILESSSSPSSLSRLRFSSKVKRCKSKVRRRCHKTRTSSSSSEVARRLVRKRTKVLRGMIPGGQLLDEISLLHEAMDYVVHLHAQVGVLRRITKAVQRSNSSGILTPSAQSKDEAVQLSDEKLNR